MSLEAYIWAADVRLPDTINLTAFRVLLKMANNADRDGRNVFRSNRQLADELEVDKRTIERAIRTLRNEGLIRPGDQMLVSHLRGDRRPTVYDLNLRFGTAYDVAQPLHGATRGDAPHGPAYLSRGDKSDPYGPTTVVAQGTVIEPSRTTTQGDYRRTDPDAGPLCKGGCGRHLQGRRAQRGVCLDCEHTPGWFESVPPPADWRSAVKS